MSRRRHVSSYFRKLGGGGGGAAAPSGSQELITPERVRTFFPETWLWTNATTESDTANSVIHFGFNICC